MGSPPAEPRELPENAPAQPQQEPVEVGEEPDLDPSADEPDGDEEA